MGSRLWPGYAARSVALLLADALAAVGRVDKGVRLFERVLDLRNDLGLLSEEYDTHTGRQAGNTPQAFSHVGLVNTARQLDVAVDDLS